MKFVATSTKRFRKSFEVLQKSSFSKDKAAVALLELQRNPSSNKILTNLTPLRSHGFKENRTEFRILYCLYECPNEDCALSDYNHPEDTLTSECNGLIQIFDIMTHEDYNKILRNKKTTQWMFNNFYTYK